MEDLVCQYCGEDLGIEDDYDDGEKCICSSFPSINLDCVYVFDNSEPPVLELANEIISELVNAPELGCVPQNLLGNQLYVLFLLKSSSWVFLVFI